MLRFSLFMWVFFLFVSPLSSHAAEETHNWKSIFVGGASFSGKTGYSIKESNGTLLGTSNDQANAGALFAGELTYQSSFPLGMGLLVEGTRYNYTSGSPDGELAVYLMPRLAQSIGPIEFWAGLGLGLMVTTLGGARF